MCEIRPFPGIHYNPRQPDISSKLSPPYDVLSEDDKQRLLARDPQNFVRIDLPFTPPKYAGPPAAYAEARRSLDQWLNAAVLVRDEQPSLYVYHQSFSHAGRRFVRKMFFARLRLEEFGKGSVYPHEQTFGGPKEDRLLLTQATACNLSPIFGLYPDPENAVADLLEKSLKSSLLRGELDGTSNELWTITDPALIKQVQQMMTAKPVYIADGHHRYGTAMLYRDWLKTEHHIDVTPEHPASFVLCVFCAMEDEGLLILPTHRVLPGTPIDIGTLRADTETEVLPLDATQPDQVLKTLESYGPQALAVRAADQKYYALRPKRADLLDALEPNHSAAWRRLALAFLHAYLLDRVVSPLMPAGRQLEIHYVKNSSDAVHEAASTNGAVFLLQPNTMQELQMVCSAGDLMPQKSTFFFPKLASGLVVNPLA